MIVNLYERDQGIGAHIDSLNYGNMIITISLLADTVMTFSNKGTEIGVYLPRLKQAKQS